MDYSNHDDRALYFSLVGREKPQAYSALAQARGPIFSTVGMKRIQYQECDINGDSFDSEILYSYGSGRQSAGELIGGKYLQFMRSDEF